jgi:hypothetical protein
MAPQCCVTLPKRFTATGDIKLRCVFVVTLGKLQNSKKLNAKKNEFFFFIYTT